MTSTSRPQISIRGFTIVELLIVVAIVAILAGIVLAALYQVRSKSAYARTVEDMQEISAAMELYHEANGSYPPDVNRGLPTGAEQYIAGGVWPTPAYPNAVFDWDNWTPAQQTYPPNNAEVVQISMRFCPIGGATSTCTIPNEPWAANFNAQSALYYCIQGACRAHSAEPIDWPAYCVNCNH